ncbi:linear amide C-N hydrolase [Rhodococcus maanshanensis]|uniref:Choloylglycine hydrolase n=1 Tax=Rhodococcus maanshanensis TaxID=183556 RepID=A0A1H7FD17_9NOCA|nr:linear amide C-N hydrolase [Rhodococcus maanshanensis]SEK23644.1 choloylglycine hydrolase [Rhodococcus maanshanensis]
MCTRALWTGSGHGVLVGRNMDWCEEMDTNLWVLPRGASRVGHDADPNPLSWTAVYGSIVTTTWDQTTTDGINERGLAAHILWLAEADFGERDPAVPALAASMWAQVFLDRCASVAECIELMTAQPFQIRPLVEPRSGRSATVHLALEDATGDSLIIEYIDGSVRLHHDRANTVMTNSPPYDEQLELRKRYTGFGGTQPLPGTTEAADRFVRASYYLDRLPASETTERSYAALLSVMRNAAQPFGEPDPDRPNISMTIWRTLADLTTGTYIYESSFSPNIVWTRLADFDFTSCRKLDLSAPGLLGDVGSAFAESAPPDFALS